MKLTTVKEIYKNREEYLNREVTVGGWVRSVRDSKTFGFIVYFMMVLFLRHCRLYITTICRILPRSAS